MRRLRLSLLVLSVFGLCGLSHAQAPAAHAAPVVEKVASQIKLGQAIVPLPGPWKFHTGDNPRWADPNFNDADWKTMDLTPPEGSVDPSLGTSGYIPGW